MIGIHKELKFKVKVTKLNKDKFTGTVIESNEVIYPLGYYGVSFDVNQYDLIEETSEETSEINTPKHYDNSKGTLYKVAQERGWNTYLFDIVKRLERAEKKGNFKEDLEKSIAVIQLYLKEHEI
jgi:hypothetical protein